MNKSDWVLILGGSSGFGLSTAKLLASKGFNILIVHRDLKANQTEIDEHFEDIRSTGVQVHSINKNANTEEGHSDILAFVVKTLKDSGKIKVLMHSLADGNLGDLISGSENDLDDHSFDHTIKSMGTSFITWGKLILKNKLFADNARIIGITSEGGHRVLPGYAAVGAAKSVLESACRYMAVEFAKFNITTNLINAGITDSSALRAIPNHESIMRQALAKNPFKRLTQPADVANVVYLLSREGASWINGEIIRVDGGEQIVF